MSPSTYTRKRTLSRSDFFARFKTDGFSWRDRDLAPRSGVSPYAAFAGLDAEDAEPSEFDPLPVVHGRFQNLDQRAYLNRMLRLG